MPRGATIGRYFILKRLGEGGMGEVYAAFDPELDRKIALKVLRPARRVARGSVAQARLLREAQAMARISHPNVVAVHDVGAHGDEVFIAMELVEGGTLTEWVGQKPRRLDELLRAFVEAGHGLEAAHQVGLVHRDFKPENVLVGADGRVRVTDFGLARVDELGAVEDRPPSLSIPALTQDGAIVGTPLFMSPEQAQGRVPDGRSDQYGFCASLYWAIYGQPPPSPFGERGPDSDAATPSWNVEPTTEPDKAPAPARPPITLPREPKIPSNVRRALLRGLSWDASGRFASMNELLAELAPRRRPVAQRWVALAAVLAGVVVAGAVMMRLERRPAELCAGAEKRLLGKWDDAARAAVKASFAAADPTGGQEAARRTVALLDRYASSWASTYVEACEATRLHGEQTEAILSLRMICLDRRLHQMAVLANLFRSADAKLVQQSVDATLGLPPLSSCDAAAQSLAAAPPRDPEIRTQIDAIGRQLDEVRALSTAGRFKSALALSAQAVSAAEQVGYWPARAESLALQGLSLDASGDPKGAERVLQKAVVAADTARTEVDKVRALTRLIYVEGCELGKFEDGHFYAEAARPVLANLGHAPLEFEFHLQLGALLGCQARTEESLSAYQRALDLVDRALGEGHPKKGVLLNNMADRYTALGRYEDALRTLRQALQILSAVYGTGHPEVAYIYYNMSEVLRRLGDTKGAYDAIQEAIRIRKAGLGPDHPLVADALDRLAIALLADGLHAEALVECERSLAIREKALGADHPDVSYSLENLGAALIGVRQPLKAIPVLERAIAIRSRGATGPGDLAEPRFSLARAQWDAGKDKARARALAAQAREGYLQAGQREEAEKVARWIAAH